jgi:hypothetical protein
MLLLSIALSEHPEVEAITPRGDACSEDPCGVSLPEVDRVTTALYPYRCRGDRLLGRGEDTQTEHPLPETWGGIEYYEQKHRVYLS